MSNAHLHKAKKARNDLFYTRREDVEKELEHYTDQLEGRWVYMPFDTEKSAFWQYFKDNFHRLKLKHITATNYDLGEGAFRYDYDGKEETIAKLEENGDFRSEECTKIMDECDLVCSNGPFSLFRDTIYWLNGGRFIKDKDGNYVRQEK